MPNLNKDYLSFIKVRGSWASVGSAFSRYLANPHYEWNSSSGQWSITTQYPLYNLKPERTNSWEIGLNMRFLKNFELDVTYYNAKTMNQTFNRSCLSAVGRLCISRLVPYVTPVLSCH